MTNKGDMKKIKYYSIRYTVYPSKGGNDYDDLYYTKEEADRLVKELNEASAPDGVYHFYKRFLFETTVEILYAR